MGRRQRQQQQHHFLLVAYSLQSHLNPVLQLAKTLTSQAGARVTFSTTVFAHRRMFPDTPTTFPLDDPNDPLLTYHPYSDGYDDGFDRDKYSFDDRLSRTKVIGQDTLRAVATASGSPAITCVIYAILMPWVPDVAHELGVPSVLYWIQSATVFAAYHHYFHGYRDLIEQDADDPASILELPGLPTRLRRRDLPSFFAPAGSGWVSNKSVLSCLEESYRALDKESADNGGAKPRVLVNSFHMLEHEAIAAIENVELIPIGPMLPPACLGMPSDQPKVSAGEAYTEWLDQWAERSVVYVSFGSLMVLGKTQKEEIARALVGCGRPFLWVVRGEMEGAEEAEGAEEGKVVEWCNQVEVLLHGSIGCFVTHCGWNSTLESLACGVPIVGMPHFSDQPTNAKTSEGLWGVGPRAAVNEEGVVEGEELRRCLELVMGETVEGAEFRRRAAMWKEKAREAMSDVSSFVKAFIDGITATINQ